MLCHDQAQCSFKWDGDHEVFVRHTQKRIVCVASTFDYTYSVTTTDAAMMRQTANVVCKSDGGIAPGTGGAVGWLRLVDATMDAKVLQSYVDVSPSAVKAGPVEVAGVDSGVLVTVGVSEEAGGMLCHDQAQCSFKWDGDHEVFVRHTQKRIVCVASTFDYTYRVTASGATANVVCKSDGGIAMGGGGAAVGWLRLVDATMDAKV